MAIAGDPIQMEAIEGKGRAISLRSSTLSRHQQVTTICASSSHAFCSPNCLSAALASSHPPWVCQALDSLQGCPSFHIQNEELQIQVKFLIAAYSLAIRTKCPFGLMEPFGRERSVRAYGLYPKASFFNHDCLPNVCRFDYVDGGCGAGTTDILIRVIRDVPQGRELCLSYFPVSVGWSEDEDVDGEMEEEEVAMEDDDDLLDDEQMYGDEKGGCNDFPHACFFVRYMCEKEICGGMLAPLPPSGDGHSSNGMECNV
uniref:SET domain-containing protein n=1 Tax=Kalanchoe fedtschenkoi TaxID=63787 RepID=A0A7N0TRU6_KALFE